MKPHLVRTLDWIFDFLFIGAVVYGLRIHWDQAIDWVLIAIIGLSGGIVLAGIVLVLLDIRGALKKLAESGPVSVPQHAQAAERRAMDCPGCEEVVDASLVSCPHCGYLFARDRRHTE